jgi:hypothetical protein
LKWYSLAIPLANIDCLHVLVFHEKGVWRTLHEDGSCPFHLQRVLNLHQGDSAVLLEFCHWLHTNRQLLPLTLFTDEAMCTVTRNGIDNTRKSYQWSHHNSHGTVEKKFSFVSLSVCGAV